MILLSKIDGEQFTLNCELIETIYEKPDTTIHLTNGKIYIVTESMDEIIAKSISYHKEIYGDILNSRY